MAVPYSQPLSLPAILINPKSRAQIQVAAFAEQQRAHAAAQRPAGRTDKHDEHGMRRKGEGKRSLRRRENAVLIHNPYASAPTASDYLPPPPTHLRSFPSPSPRSIQSTSAPSPSLPTSDPTSTAAGAYTLSLKGVRQLLRKRGRRAEVVVGIVESELTGWLEGIEEDGMGRVRGWGQPRIVDSTPTESSDTASSSTQFAPVTSATLPTTSDRSLPRAFTTSPSSSPEYLFSVLTSFYSSSGTETLVKGKRKTSRPAVVELMRSPGHLIWAVADGFERLVVHLLCRYYELISFSQTLPASTSNGTPSPSYRITHILHPTHLHPPTTSSLLLATPDNTDLDTASSSTETEVGLSTSEGEATESEGGMFESDSEREEVVYAGRQPVRTAEAGRRDRSVDSDWSDVGATPSPLSSGWVREETPTPHARVTPSQRRRHSTSTFSADGEDSSGDESLPGMMDSLLLEGQQRDQPGWTSELVVSSLPERSGWEMGGGEGGVEVPLDLFPARRMQGERRRRVTFFEYLYG